MYNDSSMYKMGSLLNNILYRNRHLWFQWCNSFAPSLWNYAKKSHFTNVNVSGSKTDLMTSRFYMSSCRGHCVDGLDFIW